MKSFISTLTLSYLRFFARIALLKHKPTIIGIAGSVGKSSTRNALEAILKDHFPTKSVGNSETGIPLGILGLTPNDYSKKDWLLMLLKAPFGIPFLKNTKYLVAEMGIDDPFPPKNMEYLLTILRPDIAIVLNESATHSEQFEKALPRSEVTDTSSEEKLKLVIQLIAGEDCKIITQSNCKTAIYNADDENINTAIEQWNNASNNATFLPFGQDKTNAISYKDYIVDLKETSFSFLTKNNLSSEALRAKEDRTMELTIKNLALPQEYQQVFASAIIAGLQTELTIEQIISSLEKNFSLPNGRSSLLKGINHTVIIDSSYNASKTSNFAFLDLVAKLKKQTKREVVFLMGDMRELGEEAKLEHEAVAHKMIGIVDYVYLVGPLTREFVLPHIDLKLEIGNWKFKEISWFDTSKRAGEYLEKHLPKNAIVLVKGSQNTIFLEEAIKYILADKKDATKLCRQNDFWINVKKMQNLP